MTKFELVKNNGDESVVRRVVCKVDDVEVRIHDVVKLTMGGESTYTFVTMLKKKVMLARSESYHDLELKAMIDAGGVIEVFGDAGIHLNLLPPTTKSRFLSLVRRAEKEKQESLDLFN